LGQKYEGEWENHHRVGYGREMKQQLSEGTFQGDRLIESYVDREMSRRFYYILVKMEGAKHRSRDLQGETEDEYDEANGTDSDSVDLWDDED